MTRCILYVSGRDDIRGFLCAGHAGFGEEGQDIVCAAVSALTQGCAGIRPRLKVAPGFLALMLPEGCESHDAQVLLHGMLQGLRDIHSQYPAYLRLDVRQESERRK